VKGRKSYLKIQISKWLIKCLTDSVFWRGQRARKVTNNLLHFSKPPWNKVCVPFPPFSYNLSLLQFSNSHLVITFLFSSSLITDLMVHLHFFVEISKYFSGLCPMNLIKKLLAFSNLMSANLNCGNSENSKKGISFLCSREHLTKMFKISKKQS
jgi:hypothetical protein